MAINAKRIKSDSTFDLSFKSLVYEDGFKKKLYFNGNKSNLKFRGIILILSIATLAYTAILKIFNRSPRKDFFLNYSFEVLVDSISSSIFLHFIGDKIYDFSKDIIPVIHYIQIFIPFQVISGSIQAYFHFSSDPLFLILAAEFWIRYVFLTLSKYSYNAILFSTTIILVYQWIILAFFHKFIYVLNYLVIYTFVLGILCVIAYLKEKDLRNNFLKDRELNEQRDHFEKILNGIKICFVISDGEKAYYNKEMMKLCKQISKYEGITPSPKIQSNDRLKHHLSNFATRLDFAEQLDKEKWENNGKSQEGDSSELISLFGNYLLSYYKEAKNYFKDLFFLQEDDDEETEVDFNKKLAKRTSAPAENTNEWKFDVDNFLSCLINNISSLDPNLDHSLKNILSDANPDTNVLLSNFSFFKEKLKECSDFSDRYAKIGVVKLLIYSKKTQNRC